MIGILAMAAAAAAEPQPNCKNPMTQTDINICAGRDARAADAVMAREYGRARMYMKRMDRALDRKSDDRITYSAALLASQRAWLKFRDAQCVIDGYSARGGSMESMVRSGCYEEITRDRTKQLQDVLKSYQAP